MHGSQKRGERGEGRRAVAGEQGENTSHGLLLAARYVGATSIRTRAPIDANEGYCRAAHSSRDCLFRYTRCDAEVIFSSDATRAPTCSIYSYLREQGTSTR